jgi:hypothetical protein
MEAIMPDLQEFISGMRAKAAEVGADAIIINGTESYPAWGLSYYTAKVVRYRD